MCNQMHKFEEAGLGKAPFRLIAVRENRVKIGDVVRAGGCCDYCSNGIAYEFVCQSADGKKFKVGSDCVLRLDSSTNRSFINQVKSEKNRIENEARKARAEVKRAADAATWAQAKKLIEENAETLKAQPHPKIAGKTLLDYYRWIMSNTSVSTCMTLAKKIVAEFAPATV